MPLSRISYEETMHRTCEVEASDAAEAEAAFLKGTATVRRVSAWGEPETDVVAVELVMRFLLTAMSASDGLFNATTENVTASLNTTGLSSGKHIVYVQGQDAAGNWGLPTAVFLTIN